MATSIVPGIYHERNWTRRSGLTEEDYAMVYRLSQEERSARRSIFGAACSPRSKSPANCAPGRSSLSSRFWRIKFKNQLMGRLARSKAVGNLELSI